MGTYGPSGTPRVRWQPLERYAAGEFLLISSGDSMYAGRLLQGSPLALTFYFFKFEIPAENRHLKKLITLLRILSTSRISTKC